MYAMHDEYKKFMCDILHKIADKIYPPGTLRLEKVYDSDDGTKTTYVFAKIHAIEMKDEDKVI